MILKKVIIQQYDPLCCYRYDYESVGKSFGPLYMYNAAPNVIIESKQ